MILDAAECTAPEDANLRFVNYDAEEILGILQPMLAASTRGACTSGMQEPSYVLCAIGLEAEECGESIRFGFGRFTTDTEIDRAEELVLQAIGSLSHLSRRSAAT